MKAQSKEFFSTRVLHFLCSGCPFLEGREGCILFKSSFPSVRGGCLMCVCSLEYARIAYLYENRITITRIII